MSSLPLHAFVGVQDTVSLPVPAHCFPSYAGAGFEQDRVRVLVPETVPDVGWQVTEHAPYDPQLAQFPSTESKLFHCINFVFHFLYYYYVSLNTHASLAEIRSSIQPMRYLFKRRKQTGVGV